MIAHEVAELRGGRACLRAMRGDLRRLGGAWKGGCRPERRGLRFALGVRACYRGSTMRKTACATLLALAMGGCTAVTGGRADPAPVSLHAPTSEQISAIAAAEARPGFAGSWYDGGVLNLAFDGKGFERARNLSAENIRVVQVRFGLEELEAARQRVLRLIEQRGGPGMFAVTIDKPRNGVRVEPVETIGSPGATCLGPDDLPPSDADGVPIFNEARCGGR